VQPFSHHETGQGVHELVGHPLDAKVSDTLTPSFCGGFWKFSPLLIVGVDDCHPAETAVTDCVAGTVRVQFILSTLLLLFLFPCKLVPSSLEICSMVA
jgi:hypothetical protein